MAASQLFQNMRESARFLLLANKSNVSACMNAIQPYSKFKPFQQNPTLLNKHAREYLDEFKGSQAQLAVSTILGLVQIWRSPI